MTDGDMPPQSRQSRTMRHLSRRESGQAAVETAIVMPLFVFIVLGLVQLALMHQARLMTKYAAYKATRAGAIHNAKKKVMQNAAAAVLVPFMAAQGDSKNPMNFKTTSASEYNQAWSTISGQIDDWVAVTVCNPTQDMNPVRDFDKGEQAYGGGRANWKNQSATRLNIQVAFYYKLLIPFANGVLWWITYGEEKEEMLKLLRLGQKAESFGHQAGPDGQKLIADFKSQANSGTYILPIRASYGMRMHSNILKASDVDSKNKCLISFAKQ